MKKTSAFLFLFFYLWGLTQGAWALALRVRNNAFEGKTQIRSDGIYAAINPLALALGVRVGKAGEGKWAAFADPAATPEVPAGQISVAGQLLPTIEGEDGEVYVSAEAFCKALGGTVRHDLARDEVNLALGQSSGVHPTEPGSQPPPAHATSPAILQAIPADPSSFFITQYPSLKNKWGNWKNGNCGPTCLSMMAVAYGQVPPGMQAGDRQGLILWCREAMTGGSVDESKGVNYHQMERAAVQLNLNPKLIRKFNDLDGELGRGRMAIIAGFMSSLGFSRNGSLGHAILVVGKSGDNYIVNDPGGFYKVPGTLVPRLKMKAFFLNAVSMGP